MQEPKNPWPDQTSPANREPETLGRITTWVLTTCIILFILALTATALYGLFRLASSWS